MPRKIGVISVAFGSVGRIWVYVILKACLTPNPNELKGWGIDKMEGMTLHKRLFHRFLWADFLRGWAWGTIWWGTFALWVLHFCILFLIAPLWTIFYHAVFESNGDSKNEWINSFYLNCHLFDKTKCIWGIVLASKRVQEARSPLCRTFCCCR